MIEPKRFKTEGTRSCLDQFKLKSLPLLRATLTDHLRALADSCRTFPEVRAASCIVGGLSNEISKQLCSESLEEIENSLVKRIRNVNFSCQAKKSREFKVLEKDCRWILQLLENAMQTNDPSIDPKAGERFWFKYRKLPPLNVF